MDEIFNQETNDARSIRDIFTIDETYPISENEGSYIFGRSACKNSAVNVQIKQTYYICWYLFNPGN